MNTQAMKTIVVAALLGALPGCNQADPVVDTDAASESGQDPSSSTGEVADGPETEGSDDPPPPTTGADATDTDAPPGEADYFPLVDGATWTYRHVSAAQGVWDEVVVMREVEYEGQTAYESEDNEDTDNQITIATLRRDNTMTLRVHKEVSLAGVPTGEVDYDPGFLRFDNAWQEGDSLVWTYDRTEYDATGALLGVSGRNMIFTVESMSTEVTVLAGTFDCVQVRRERIDNGEIKRYWFADGVGKIKHESVGSGTSEELVEYSIP